MEEDTEIPVPSTEFALVVGQPAQFRFFSSNTRKEDAPGTLLDRWTEEELAETAPLVATLSREDSDDNFVPVKFRSKITELGMFELWCEAGQSDESERWKLEFNVRES
jgi:hypothetical protein